MTDKDFFYATYKDLALKFQDELILRISGMIETFPENDPMRLETLRFVGQGGKRLRSVLARLVTRFYGFEESEATATLDTFHKFLLCHDDIIDRDRMRWGMPTVHAALENQAIDVTQREHFGNSLGLISGDLMASIAHRMTLESGLEDRIKVALMKLICKCMDEVAWGWYDQFLMDYLPLDSELLSFERIRQSVIWVTGKYTISFPLRFGYCAMGIEVPKELEDVADSLGVLFQTGDDLIGVFGDSQKSGKSNYGDIVQGKKTIPLWFSYQKAMSNQKDRLRELIGKKEILEQEVDEVRTIMMDSGGVDETKRFMADYASKVKQGVNRASIPNDLSRFLVGFAEYLVEREA